MADDNPFRRVAAPVADSNPFRRPVAPVAGGAGAGMGTYLGSMIGQSSVPAPGGAPAESIGDRVGQAWQFTDDMARMLASGASLGWADEAAGRMNAIGAPAYEDTVAIERARDAAIREAHPVASTAAEIAGGVGSALTAGVPAVGARILGAGAATLPGRVAAGATGGAGAGFVAGAGSADTGDRLSAGALGALTGGAIGAALPAAAHGVGAILDRAAAPALGAARREPIRAGQRIEDAAARRLRQALRRDRVTPEQAAGTLRGLGPSGAVMDAGGRNLTDLADTVALSPGRGKETIETFLQGRQEGQQRRVLGAVRQGVSPEDDLYGTIDDLMASRRTAGAPLYDDFYALPAQTSERLQALLARPSAKAAIGRAYRIAADEGVPAKDLTIVDFSVSDDPVFGAVPNWMTLDYVKRGLDDILEGYRDPTTGLLRLDESGRAVDSLRRQYLEEVDSLSGGAYKAARDAWAGPSQSLDALARGRRFFSADSEMTERNIARLSEGDKAFFRAGAARALQDLIQRTPDGVSAVRRIFGSTLQRDRLRALFPEEAAFREFERQMLAEARMFATRSAVTGNSATARRLAAQADQQGGIMGSLALDAVTTGYPAFTVGSMARRLSPMFLRPSEPENEMLARLLTAPKLGGSMMMDQIAGATVGDYLRQQGQAARIGASGASGGMMARLLTGQ